VRLRLHYLIVATVGVTFAELAWAAPPPGWIVAGNTPTSYAFAVSTATPVSGSRSASITAKPTATRSGFGTLMQVIAADDYRGSRVRLSGYLRTSDADRSQMWMRVDGPNQQVLAFDNMDSHPITGTTAWKRYDIVLNVPRNSVDVAFGFLLAGRGAAWGADFELEKVGAAVPVTSRGPILPRQPINLNFEMAAVQGNARGVADGPFPTIAADNGRIFVYRAATHSGFAVELKLNGKAVGMVHPNQLFFFDRPPGNYTATAIHPGVLSFGGFDGHINPMDAPATEHALTFHLDAGQVRYIRLGTRGSNVFVTQAYPQLVDVAVGRAQTDEIFKSGGSKIKTIATR
jgi:hypothetical protein